MSLAARANRSFDASSAAIPSRAASRRRPIGLRTSQGRRAPGSPRTRRKRPTRACPRTPHACAPDRTTQTRRQRAEDRPCTAPWLCSSTVRASAFGRLQIAGVHRVEGIVLTRTRVLWVELDCSPPVFHGLLEIEHLKVHEPQVALPRAIRRVQLHELLEVLDRLFVVGARAGKPEAERAVLLTLGHAVRVLERSLPLGSRLVATPEIEQHGRQTRSTPCRTYRRARWPSDSARWSPVGGRSMTNPAPSSSCAAPRGKPS